MSKFPAAATATRPVAPPVDPFADPQAALRRAHLRPKKSWGQNFLRDPSVHAEIVAAAGCGPHSRVVELGAGLGALTQPLLASGAQVVAVERDRDLVPLLRRSFVGSERFELLEADAGKLDYAALQPPGTAQLTVVGNLPYQLSSRILVNLAAAAPHVQTAVLLVQREVAQRVVAHPGRDAGLLTVLVQRAFAAHLHLEVPPQAFYPAPKVHSAVLVLRRRTALLSAPLDTAVVWTARAAYAARRKTLTNTLSLGCQVPKAQMAALLQGLDISPAQRPEALSLPQLTQIAAALLQAGLVP